MSNPIPNISDVDYLAVQEANRLATPSVHSNTSWLHLGSHSRIETLLTPDHASAQHSLHSNPAEQESTPRMPEGSQARWQYIMRRVSTLPGLQRTEESEEPAPPTLPNELNNSDTYGALHYQAIRYQVNDDNLPSLEECAKEQDSGTDRSETQPNYFTNPFESDNDFYASEETPISIHPTISVEARPRDSSVFVSEKYNTDHDADSNNALDSNRVYPPIEPLRKTNSEVQGMWQML
jgi:hypothetical protein